MTDVQWWEAAYEMKRTICRMTGGRVNTLSQISLSSLEKLFFGPLTGSIRISKDQCYRQHIPCGYDYLLFRAEGRDGMCGE